MAGLPFGITIEEAQRICVAGLGEFSPSKHDPDDRMCSRAPVNPFQGETRVALRFRQGTLCQVRLVVGHASEDSLTSVDTALRERYGPGKANSASDGPEVQRVWERLDASGPAQHRLTYSSMLLLDRDAGNTFYRGISSVDYTNKEGLDLEARRAAERAANY